MVAAFPASVLLRCISLFVFPTRAVPLPGVCFTWHLRVPKTRFEFDSNRLTFFIIQLGFGAWRV